MSFDKEKYRENRDSGLRGQGETVKTQHSVKNGSSVVGHNRRMHRLKESFADRRFTRKGYSFGRNPRMENVQVRIWAVGQIVDRLRAKRLKRGSLADAMKKGM